MPTVNKADSESWSMYEETNTNPNSSFTATERFIFDELAVCSGVPPVADTRYQAIIDPAFTDVTF